MSNAEAKNSRISKASIGCVVVIGVFLAGSYWLYRLNRDINNSYAVWWVADMVVEHLKANDNQWPSTWNDLSDDYQTCVDRSSQPWSFAELSERVVIDWQADPNQLLAQSTGHAVARFKVIMLSDGTDSHGESREPNQIILDYLRSTEPAE